MKVVIDGVNYVPEESKEFTLADVFDSLKGAKEWDATVAKIQRWFYNVTNYPKTPWCATCVCFGLAGLGLLTKTVGSREENVYNLNTGLNNHTEKVRVSDMKRGDICIFNWSGTFSTGSSKHVSVYTGKDNLFIGGNQSNSIRETAYDKEKIVAVYRPNYSQSVIKDMKHFYL